MRQRNTIRDSRRVCQAFLLCTPTYNPAANVPEAQSGSVTYLTAETSIYAHYAFICCL